MQFRKNNIDRPVQKSLSFNSLIKSKGHDDSHEGSVVDKGLNIPRTQHTDMGMNSTKDILTDISGRHPFQDKVFKGFDRKNIFANFDWMSILIDIKKRLPYLIVFIIMMTGVAIYFTYSKWGSKQVYVAHSKMLYKEIKFESKQVLPTSTSLAMLQHKDLLKNALIRLPEYKTISELKAAINVVFDKKSKLINIEVTSRNEGQAINTTNILAELGILASKNYYYRHFQEKYSNLSNQVKLTEQDMIVQDRMIAQAMKKNGALNTRGQYRIIMEAMSLQERNLLEAKIDYKKQQVQLEVLKAEYAKMPDEVVRNSYEDNPLKAQLTNTKMSLFNAQSIYGEGNPKILAIQEKIEGLKKQLASQDIKSTLQKVYMPNARKQEVYMEIARSEGQLKSALDRIESIQLNLEQQKTELYAVPEKEMKLDDILRKREATAQLLDVLRKKQQDVEIMMKSEIKDLTLYEYSDQASLIQPLKLLALVPGTVVLTCLISFMYLLINCVLDQSIKTKKQLDINFNIPCVMQLTESHNSEKNMFKEFAKLVGMNNPQSLNNVICLQSQTDCDASENLVKFLTAKNKSVLMITYSHNYEASESTPSWDLAMDSNEESLIDTAHITSEGQVLFTGLLDRLKKLSYDYDFIIVSLTTEEIDKAQLGIINFADWYFYVVDACHTKRANLLQKLKEMEFKGICPEGFILDKVKEPLLQV
jgi:capsular polysaccharide biosynthesis protein